MRKTLTGIVLLFAAGALPAHGAPAAAAEGGKWFTAWSISIGHRMGPTFTGANYAPDVSNSALRMIVRPSIAGNAVRVRIENTQAQTPVTFSGAYVGRLASGSAPFPGPTGSSPSPASPACRSPPARARGATR